MKIVVIGGSGLTGSKLVDEAARGRPRPAGCVAGLGRRHGDRRWNVFVQPEAADDVVAALTDVAVNAPVNGIVELAGPERFRLDELAQRVLSANSDPRRVAADAHARCFGAELDDHSLTPGANPRIAPTRFEDWLSQSTARHTNLATERET